MKLRLLLLCVLLGCLAESTFPQSLPIPYVLQFSGFQAKEEIQVHYYLSGKFPYFLEGEPEGSLSAQGDAAVKIPTRFVNADATGLFMLIYQPGCQFQYLEVEDLKNSPHTANISCLPGGSVAIHAVIQNHSDMGATNLVAEVHYQAYREHRINETVGTTTVDFNLGCFPISEDGSLSWSMPDLGNDLTLNQHVKHGQLRIWVHRDHDAFPLGWLVVSHESSEEQRFLPVAASYPGTVQLQLSTINRFAMY